MENKKKHTKRFYISWGIPAFIILLCVFCSMWNVIATNSERTAYPPEGQIADVFDTKIHVFPIGERSEGQPAIVLLSGLATPSPTADYFPIWSRLGKQYHVVVLERPGYGWSYSTKRERSVNNIVEESREALRQTGIEPPYIFVAHSYGGMEASMYAAAYPDEVKGVVLLDCTPPEQLKNYPSSVPLLNSALSVMRSMGIFRLIGTVAPKTMEDKLLEQRNGLAMVSEHYRELDRVFVMQKYQNGIVQGEQKMRQANAQAVYDAGFPSSIPLSLIVSVQEGDENHPQYQDYMDRQAAWANHSDEGRVYTLTGGHYIHHYDPDMVCNIIDDLILSNP